MLGRALLPLRAFLGVTFGYAGLQKLANPGFFQASNPGSIQAQLAGSARSSPISGLVSPLTHVAVPIGVLIALAELAIGLGTLLGLWQRLAAAGGMVLSLLLFLTVSFHATPYYTGADIVFLFAWTPLLLAGAGPYASADTAFAARARARQAAGPMSAEEATRRDIALRGTITAMMAVAGLILGGVVAGIGRLAGGVKSTSSTPRLSPAQPAPSSTGPASGHPPGTAIGAARNVPIGGSASFTDPGTGNPAIVIQATAGQFVAFDAVCPHAGCTVGYDKSAVRIVCPCHGSEFNSRTGAVEVGPATRGLAPITIAEGGNGQLYAT